MSRTYHHGRKAKERLRPFKFYSGRYSWNEEETPPKKKRRMDYFRWMITPSWWIREFMTVPQRVEVRGLLQKTLHLKDYEDSPEFPLAKKPHQYFW